MFIINLASHSFENAYDGLMGTKECVVVSSVGDDDVGFVEGRNDCYELVFQGFEADAVFGLELLGFSLNTDDGLTFTDGNVGVGHTGFCHEQDDAGTTGSCH